MTGQIREVVASVAGRLVGRGGADGIFDQAGDPDRDGLAGRLTLKSYPGNVSCGMRRSPDGTNYCLVDEQSGRHICLSLYGRLFDGYDNGSSSHFSGFVDHDAVSFYDYSESNFFDYRV